MVGSYKERNPVIVIALIREKERERRERGRERGERGRESEGRAK